MVDISLIILSLISILFQFHINQKLRKINFPPTPLIKIKASTMASTNVRFTPCDIDLFFYFALGIFNKYSLRSFLSVF